MPDGGELICDPPQRGPEGLPARERAQGGYVLIEVADTGVGMAPEIRRAHLRALLHHQGDRQGHRAWGCPRSTASCASPTASPGLEPAGGGDELQALPAVHRRAGRGERDAPPSLKRLRGSERVLVVEDDASVLAMTLEMLETLGYHVESATDAASALALLEQGTEVDLILTDVVMPGGVNGVELARAARELRPDVAILLTSGYVSEAARFRDSEFALIDKPFDPAELAAKLREQLRAQSSARRRTAKREPAVQADA